MVWRHGNDFVVGRYRVGPAPIVADDIEFPLDRMPLRSRGSLEGLAAGPVIVRMAASGAAAHAEATIVPGTTATVTLRLPD